MVFKSGSFMGEGSTWKGSEMIDSEDKVKPEDTLATLVSALPVASRDLITAKTKVEFDLAFAAIVVESVQRLERDSKNLSVLSEDGLSTVFVGFVNGTRALIATREEFSNGHVDMTFRAPLSRPSREVLGEAKIFNYYQWHEEGLLQLITRYSTGREDRGLLLVYVKMKNIRKHMESLQTELNRLLPCDQTKPCEGHSTRWSFITTHKHSSGEELEVWHLGCNLQT